MTWLSRLLPQSPSLQRLADPNHRTRQGKRRRRMATLERLEDRTLLSNVMVSENLLTHALTITGDAHNDNFIIQENSAASGGQVSVSPGNSLTTIGGLHTPFTSQQGILTLTVILNGTSNNTDVVKLLGTAPAASSVKTVTITTPTVVSPNFGETLDFTGNNLNNPGTFSLTAYGTLAGPGPKGTPASLDNSTFNAVTITQIGCCPAHVELGNDHVSGSVNVSEGYGTGDTITLTNDTFGSTVLAQNAGPVWPMNGDGDVITVTSSKVKDLVVTQGNGNGDQINVDTLGISLVGGGVSTTQGNGNGDTTSINLVTINPTTITPNKPANWVCPSITVSQGDGVSDQAKVTNSIVPGNIEITQGKGLLDFAQISDSSAGWVNGVYKYGENKGCPILVCGIVSITQGDGNHDIAQVLTVKANYIYITQGNGGPYSSLTGDEALVDSSLVQGNVAIVQGNGDDDVAAVTNTTAGSSVPIPGKCPHLCYGDISIDQGNGVSDSATIDTVTANYAEITQGDGDNDNALVTNSVFLGDVSIYQGKGNLDYAAVLGTSVGTTFPGPIGFNVECCGSVTIQQGDGYNDQAVLDGGDVANNVYITQGDSIAFQGCDPNKGDEVHINDTAVTSDIIISQGSEASTDENGNVIPGAVGNNVVTIGDTSPVTAGGWTHIVQAGANNTVILGGSGLGSPYDFETVFLDIYTGDGGGGFVSATNTAVDVGSNLGNDYEIDGGGDGNSFNDGGGNSNVTISGNYF